MGRNVSGGGGLALNRCEELTFTGSGIGGTFVNHNLAITAVDLAKSVLIPQGGVSVNSGNNVPIVHTVEFTSTTQVTLSFKMPGTGNFSYLFKCGLLAFQ